MAIRSGLIRRASLLGAYSLVLASPIGLDACRDATAPLPDNAVRFVPPPVYARWWTIVEACSGHTGDFAAYTWYVAPDNSLRNNAAAYTEVAARRIVLESSQQNAGSIVRHEMLHALLGPAYASGTSAHEHPPAYFQGRCAGVVYCPEIGCQDAGAAPVMAPADAPTLPLSALDIQMDVLPDRVSRTGVDRALTLIVRVTNPSAEPVWVQLDATPDLPAPWVHWYGFRIVPAVQTVPITGIARDGSAGVITRDSVRRVAFAAGQTRQLVFDLSGALYAPADYLAVGIFNTRQVWTPFTIVP